MDFSFGVEKSENLQQIKKFQREFMEIGHVPIKEKDKIQSEFRKAIDGHLEKLKISSVEISTMNYKAKFENLKDRPDAKNVIFKERNFLVNKINKLRDDVNLWENNVGFFAESKKVLKSNGRLMTTVVSRYGFGFLYITMAKMVGGIKCCSHYEFKWFHNILHHSMDSL